MSKTISSHVLLALAIALVTPAASRADEQWQVGSAPSFSSGNYGTDTRTEVLQTPFTARRLFDRGDISVVFPFTCIWGSGNVTLVNGVPVRSERLANAGLTTRSGTTVTTTSVVTRACGMGDISVNGRFYVVNERGWLPTVALRAHLKTPTASTAQGLGTGEPDEGGGLEVSRTLASRTTLMVDGGFTVIGKPAGADYNNNWWYDAGIGQDVGRGPRPVLNLSVLFEEYRALVPGLENARDVLASVSIRGANGWRVQISGQKGLSSGSPDHAFLLGASKRF